MTRDQVTLITPRETRRAFLRRSGTAALALAAGTTIETARPAHAQGAAGLSLQFGWFLNCQAAGEFVAIAKGYYRVAGSGFRLQHVCRYIDLIQIVAGGASTFGDACSIGVRIR